MESSESNALIKSIIITANAFQKSKAILVAAKSGILTKCQTALSANEVARQLLLNKQKTELLLKLLVSLKLMNLEKKENKVLFKTKTEVFSIIEGLKFLEEHWTVWDNLEQQMSTDTIIEKNKPIDSQIYVQGIRELTKKRTDKLIEIINFQGFEKVLDLGCGSGDYSFAFLNKWNNLKITLLDKKEIISITKYNAELYGIKDQLSFLAKDYFNEDLNIGLFDVIFVSQNIHLFSKTENIALFKKIKKTLTNSGIVYIHELVTNEDGTEPLDASLFSLNISLFSEGKAYSFLEIKDMAIEAGFNKITLLNWNNQGHAIIKIE
jgi:cyclopropane fatty-acyl-phospholipid synthase-like methyltransferase